jgi:hypothetical protein
MEVAFELAEAEGREVEDVAFAEDVVFAEVVAVAEDVAFAEDVADVAALESPITDADLLSGFCCWRTLGATTPIAHPLVNGSRG